MKTKSRHWGTQEQAIESFKESGFVIIKSKLAPFIFAVKDDYHAAIEQMRYYASGWWGNAAKPTFYRAFSGSAQREEYCAQMVQNAAEHEKNKNRRQKEAQATLARDYWELGDVVENSWGYDQTNVDFYQVVKVLRKTVKLRPLAQHSSDRGGPYGGKCQPVRNDFTGPAFLKRIGKNGYISFKHGASGKWDGRPCSCSSYH